MTDCLTDSSIKFWLQCGTGTGTKRVLFCFLTARPTNTRHTQLAAHQGTCQVNQKFKRKAFGATVRGEDMVAMCRGPTAQIAAQRMQEKLEWMEEMEGLKWPCSLQLVVYTESGGGSCFYLCTGARQGWWAIKWCGRMEGAYCSCAAGRP
jgi:hypothetical protein